MPAGAIELKMGALTHVQVEDVCVAPIEFSWWPNTCSTRARTFERTVFAVSCLYDDRAKHQGPGPEEPHPSRAARNRPLRTGEKGKWVDECNGGSRAQQSPGRGQSKPYPSTALWKTQWGPLLPTMSAYIDWPLVPKIGG